MKKYTLVCDVCGKEMVAPMPRSPSDIGLMGSDMIKVLVISDICPSCYKDIVFEEANKLQEG